MQAIYESFPLDEDKEEIRVITVFPEDWEKIIRCSFSVVSLMQHPEPAYAALSYVWGDSSTSAEVYIEDQVFDISQNLYHALRRLRWHGFHAGNQPLTIWADAICINQTSSEEKIHQIQLMRKVYSKCTHVLVWLGEIPGTLTEDESMLPPSILGKRYFGNNFSTAFPAVLKKPSGYPDSLMTMSEITVPKQSIIVSTCALLLTQISEGQHMTTIEPFHYDSRDTFFKGVYLAFNYLCNNAWFTRRWVIQEAVLAPSVGVLFGEISMDIDILSQAMDMIAIHTDNRCCLSSQHGHYDLRHAVRGFLQNFIPIYNLRNLKDQPTHIFELCIEFVDKEVSVQADCIYSLLGITHPPSAIIPNYTVQLCDLFTGICTDYINDNNSLSCLLWASIDHRVAGLPSWVVDWTALDNFTCNTWTIIMSLFKPSSTASIAPRVVSHNTLRTIACEIDQIDEISTGFGSMNSRSESIINLQNFGMQLMAHVSLDSQYPSGGSWREAWWRTLSADCCWGANSARRLTPNDLLFFSSRILGGRGIYDVDGGGCQNLNRPDTTFQLDDGRWVPSDAHFRDILSMIDCVLSGMVLFCTKNGYIGVAKEAVRRGDIIMLIPSIRTPMIMREVIVSEEKITRDAKQRAFLVVSFCYLHGAMDGEISVNENSFEEIRVV